MENNINKFFTQLGILAGAMFCLWLLISQIPFVTRFKVNEKQEKLEKKLGNFYNDILEKTNDVIKNDSIKIPVENIIKRICDENGMDASKIKVKIIKESEINAFAFPDNNLVVYTGLIDDANKPEELAGVIAHELAHMKHKHVMKKLITEVGVATLATIAGGGNASMEALRLVSSTAYSREFEREADRSAIDFLINAEINPMGLVDFLYRLSANEDDSSEVLKWISTHPDSEQRALDAIKQIGDIEDISSYDIMTKEEWDKFKELVKNE